MRFYIFSVRSKSTEKCVESDFSESANFFFFFSFQENKCPHLRRKNQICGPLGEIGSLLNGRRINKKLKNGEDT